VKAKKPAAGSASHKKPAKSPVREPRDLGLLGPPETTDPKAQVQYFMEMLDAFAQQGTPEATRIRTELITAVTEFEANPNKDEAMVLIRARTAGIELGLAELMLRSVRKMRDRLVQDSRKMGTGSKAGLNTRSAAEGFTQFAAGLEKLLAAAQTDDTKLRAAGHEEIAKARAALEALG